MGLIISFVVSTPLELASSRWDTASSVRTNSATYEINLEEDQSSKSWHVKGYSGILSLPEFAHLDDSQIDYVMGLQLLEFVCKQSRFEIECVNKVCQSLALNQYKFSVPERYKLDALKIYTDEGYHSYFTEKLAQQITSYFNLNASDLSHVVDLHFKKIHMIGSDFDDQFSFLADLAVVFVAENQIVADISNEMKDLVYEPIVSMFKHHMLDETFHAKYFAELLPILWEQMSSMERFIFGSNLCESMVVLGKPRTDIYYLSLSHLGFSSESISKLIDIKYNNQEWNVHRLKDRMQPTLKLLSSIGVFQDSSVSSVFHKQGLL